MEIGMMIVWPFDEHGMIASAVTELQDSGPVKLLDSPGSLVTVLWHLGRQRCWSKAATTVPPLRHSPHRGAALSQMQPGVGQRRQVIGLRARAVRRTTQADLVIPVSAATPMTRRAPRLGERNWDAGIRTTGSGSIEWKRILAAADGRVRCTTRRRIAIFDSNVLLILPWSVSFFAVNFTFDDG
jgi:hypothetical protein